jgi:hypothetical protein
VTRADETVGFIVFEAGSGMIGGVEFEAQLGPLRVRGVDDSPPYLYSFNAPFATTPLITMASQATMIGGNGGWAQIHGATAATTTDIFLSIDEDRMLDAERVHTREQVSFVVFEDPVVYPAP